MADSHTEEQRWKLSSERIAELRAQVDKMLTTMNVYECIAIRDMLSEEMAAFEESPPHVERAIAAEGGQGG